MPVGPTSGRAQPARVGLPSAGFGQNTPGDPRRSRQGVSWLALTWSLRRSLARARRSDTDVHLSLFAACPDDDRHAGRVINPVPARVSQPPAAWVRAVVHHDALTGRGRRAPPDPEPVSERGRNDELERDARPDDQTSLREQPQGPAAVAGQGGLQRRVSRTDRKSDYAQHDLQWRCQGVAIDEVAARKHRFADGRRCRTRWLSPPGRSRRTRFPGPRRHAATRTTREQHCDRCRTKQSRTSPHRGT
jgi:hypothetical protein